MTGNFLAALAAALVCMLLIWLLREMMLTPVKPGKNTRQYIFLTVNGSEPGLEHNVYGLLWLHDNRTLGGQIVIMGFDLDEETRLVAQALERDHSCITLIENGEMPEWIRKMNS